MSSPRFKHEIDDLHHVLRYCTKRRWELDRDGNAKVTRDAFPESNSPLSFNLLEFYELDEHDSLVRICECHTYEGITERGKFAKVQVRDVRLTGEQEGVGFDIKRTPWRTNRSHVSVKPSDKQAANALYLCAKEYGVLLDVPDFQKIRPGEKRRCSEDSVESR